MTSMKVVTIILLINLSIFHTFCDNSINVNIRNVINSISDRFISVSTDFLECYENFLLNYEDSESYKDQWSHLSPAYVKLDRLESFLIRYDDFSEQVNKTNLAEFFGMLTENRITPVIVISYDFVTFKPLQLLHIFKLALEFNIRNCVWQLGNNHLDFSDENRINKYSDDLRTLKILCETVKTENPGVIWNVAGVGGYLKETYDDSQESLQVIGYDWKEFLLNDINKHNLLVDRDSTLLNKISESIWIDVKRGPSNKPIIEQSGEDQRTLVYNGMACDQSCLSEGLLFAHVLGEATTGGYNTVFFNESFNQASTFLPTDLDTNSNSLRRFVMGLHKRLVARKVFNLKQMKLPFAGKASVQIYGYCASEMDGSMTFMGINYSNNRGKVNLKLNSPAKPAVASLQYVLSVTDGNILLNNEKIYNLSEVTPVYKFKKSVRNTIIFSLPPHSVGFWHLKNMKNVDCIDFEESETLKSSFNPDLISSSDTLLKHLLKGVFNPDSSKSEVKRGNLRKRSVNLSENISQQSKRMKRRMRRQLNQIDFLQNLNFDLPTLPTIKLPAFSNPINSIIPSYSKVAQDIFNGNANEAIPDIYKLSQAEKDIFKSSENNNLPFEDVYLSLSEDFVTEGIPKNQPEKVKKPVKEKKKPLVYQIHAEVDSKEGQIPSDYVEAYSKKIYSKNVKKHITKPKATEIFEAENHAGYDQSKTGPKNVELKMVLKELEPTKLQSKSALQAARKKLDNLKIVEVLDNGELQEVSKDDINPSDMAKIVEIAETAADDYEEYEDDDEFFKKETKRKRRDLSDNFIDLDDDVDASSDLPSYKLEINQENTPLADDHMDDNSLTVKAVNYFGESVQNVVKVFQSTFMGWWSLFTQ